MNHTGQKNIRHQIVFHLKLLDLLEIPQNFVLEYNYKEEAMSSFAIFHPTKHHIVDSCEVSLRDKGR